MDAVKVCRDTAQANADMVLPAVSCGGWDGQPLCRTEVSSEVTLRFSVIDSRVCPFDCPHGRCCSLSLSLFLFLSLCSCCWSDAGSFPECEQLIPVLVHGPWCRTVSRKAVPNCFRWFTFRSRIPPGACVCVCECVCECVCVCVCMCRVKKKRKKKRKKGGLN